MGSPPDTVVPFEMPRGRLIAARGAIDRLDRLRFVVDTGTFRTVVDDRIVRELGLRGTADTMSVFGRLLPAERVALPEIRLGPLRRNGLSVLAADLSGFAQRLGWRPDAIVGLDVLRGQCLVVDYGARELHFACSTGWRTSVECDPGSPYVILKASIDGRDYRLMVDTGSDVVAIFQRGAAEHATAGGSDVVAADNLASGLRLRQFTAESLRIGTALLRRQPVVVIPGDQDDGYDGVLSVAILGPRVQIDLHRMVISW
jgi:predicted aspartyl protease